MDTLIICFSTQSVGGDLTFIDYIVDHALKLGKKVVVVGIERSLLKSKYGSHGKVHFCNVSHRRLDMQPSFIMRRLSRLGNSLLKGTNYGSTTVFAPDYNRLQLSLAMFGSESMDKRIVAGFWHPESWPSALCNDPAEDRGIVGKVKTSHWLYQRRLLETLNRKSSLWFMNEISRLYNEWFYEIELDHSTVVPLPFSLIGSQPFYKRISASQRSLRVIWFGRFDYFKNPAIISVFKSLSGFSKEIDINIDLVGYGSEGCTNSLRKEIESFSVKACFLGSASLERLKAIINNYDLGVAMGYSAVTLASLGMPTVIVDGGKIENSSPETGCLFNESYDGYLGEGIYYDVLAVKKNGRRPLKSIFEDFIQSTLSQREAIGKSAAEVANRVFDLNTNTEQIFKRFSESISFRGEDVSAFRQTGRSRMLFYTEKTVQKLLKTTKDLLKR